MRKPLELLNAHFDGETLSTSEARNLSSWVRAHPDNANAVVQMGMIHEMTDSLLSVPRLLEQLSLSDDPVLKRSIGESLDRVEQRPASSQRTVAVARPGSHSTRWIAVSGMVLAASLLLAVSALLLRPASPDSNWPLVWLRRKQRRSRLPSGWSRRFSTRSM